VQLEVELVILVSLQMFWHWSTVTTTMTGQAQWACICSQMLLSDSQILGTTMAPTVRLRALLLLLITEHFVRMRNPQQQQSGDMRLCDRLVAF